MTARTELEGLIEDAKLDPLGTARSYLPKRKKELPHTAYGKRGIYVIMSPIPGLTPPDVFPGNKSFAFQCPPMDSFPEDSAFNHSDYNTVTAGEHSQPVGRALRTVSFKTIFLDWEPEWSLVHDSDGAYPAQKAKQNLYAIMNRGAPLHLRAHQSNFQDAYEVDYAATIRSIHWEIVAGEVDCYYVTISFKEFSSPDIQEFLTETSGHAKLPVALTVNNLPTGRNTLAKLAKFYYGDPSAWKLIAAANGLTHVAQNVVLSNRIIGRTKITVPVRKVTKKAKGQKR